MQKFLIIFCAIMLLFCSSAMAVRLTGALFFSTDATGVATVTSWWDTLGLGEESIGSWNLYLTDKFNPVSTDFFNTGNTAATTNINYTLQSGSNTLYFFHNRKDSFLQDSRYRTLNLYFDGQHINPAISAVYDRDTNTFVDATGYPSRRLNNTADVASGNLSFTTALGELVTLTALNVSFVGDIVSRHSHLPGDEVEDVRTMFALTVVIPEASSWLLCLIAGGLLYAGKKF